MIKDHIHYYFSATVAEKYGIHAALVLNRIIWSINYHAEHPEKWEKMYFREGVWWMDDSYQAIANHFGNLISLRTVKNVIQMLEKDGILVSKKFNCKLYDHTKWYSLNSAAYRRFLCHGTVEAHDSARHVPSKVQGVPHLDSARHVPSSSYISTNPLTISPDDPTDRTHEPTAQGESEILSIDPIPEEQNGTALALKTEKPKKTRIIPKEAVSFSPEDLSLAKLWLDYALGEMKWKEPRGSWTALKFAEDIARVRRATDLNYEGVAAVLSFVQRDDFWRPNALSPAGLLKKSPNGNRKIDNILLKMKPKSMSKYERAVRAAEQLTDDAMPF